MTIRNKLFAKIQTINSFTHVPGNDRLTTAIRQFEAEGLITIYDFGMSDDAPYWRIDRTPYAVAA